MPAEGQAPTPTSTRENPGLEEAVRTTLLLIQQDFGPRIERILGARGGLLVVLDQVDEAADLAARDRSEPSPVALIDRRTLISLQRLGATSPAIETETLFDATVAPAPTPPLPPASPGTGKASGHRGPHRPILSWPRRRTHSRRPPLHRRPGGWPGAGAEPPAGWHLALGEALPQGLLTQEQAALLMRAIARGQAGDQLPAHLLRPLAEDASRFLDQAGADWPTG